MAWINTQSVKACPASAGWPQSKLCGLWTPFKPVKRLYRSRVPNHNEMRSESCAFSLFMPRVRRFAAFEKRQLVSQQQPLWLSLRCTLDGCEAVVEMCERHAQKGLSVCWFLRNNLLAFVRPFVGVKCVFCRFIGLDFLGGVCERGSCPLVFISPSHKLK